MSDDPSGRGHSGTTGDDDDPPVVIVLRPLGTALPLEFFPLGPVASVLAFDVAVGVEPWPPPGASPRSRCRSWRSAPGRRCSSSTHGRAVLPIFRRGQSAAAVAGEVIPSSSSMSDQPGVRGEL